MIRLMLGRRLYSAGPSQSAKRLIPKLDLDKLTSRQKALIHSMLRVNQAGELGAVRIYQGQIAILGRTSDGPVLRHMLEQERVHFDTFNQLIAENRVRPTVFWPLWNIAGLALGSGTALMGREAAMMCTEAVETVIGQHYNDQIREILAIEKEKPEGGQFEQLRELFKQFRDEELEHLDHAVANDAQKAPFHAALSTAIQGGCKVAIWLSSRF